MFVRVFNYDSFDSYERWYSIFSLSPQLVRDEGIA